MHFAKRHILHQTHPIDYKHSTYSAHICIVLDNIVIWYFHLHADVILLIQGIIYPTLCYPTYNSEEAFQLSTL